MAIPSARITRSPLSPRAGFHGIAIVPTTKQYRAIVERFEEIARADLGKPRRIPDVCATLGISQRTLARAVRAMRGTTPVRHLQILALAEARKALLDPATRSVKEVAWRLGFRELGRFATHYRSVFGEKPSETFRRASAARTGFVAEPDVCTNSRL
jgi:transcriptional regulator GlxA family with amidase domain